MSKPKTHRKEAKLMQRRATILVCSVMHRLLP